MSEPCNCGNWSGSHCRPMFCNKEFQDRAWRKYVDLGMQEAMATADVIKELTSFIVEAAAQAIERHAHDIVKAGDQFDQGGDIYSAYKPTIQAAEVVRLLKPATV